MKAEMKTFLFTFPTVPWTIVKINGEMSCQLQKLKEKIREKF
jgi:hypothetical protein